MARLSSRSRVAIFAAAAVAVLVLHYLRFMQVVQPDVAYMDTLRLLAFYDQIKQGTLPFLHAWSLEAHRGLIAQTFFHLNADLFGLDILGANTASGVVLAVTAIVLAQVALNPPVGQARVEPVPWIPAAVFGSVILVSMFSLASFELFTLDYGLVLFTKNLTLIGFWIVVDRLLRASAPSWLAVVVVALAGASIVLLVAMGWSYAFVLACAVLALDAWYQQGRRREVAARGVVVVAVMVLAQFVYVGAGAGVGALDGFVGGHADQSLPLARVMHAMLLALASVFMGAEVMGELGVGRGVQAGSGALLLVAVAAAFLARLRRTGTASSIPYALMAYGFASIMAIAIARGRVEPGFAQSSRYFMDYSLLIVGLCWAAWLGPRPGGAIERRLQVLAAVLAGACVLLFGLGQAATQVQEWRKAPYRAIAIGAMRDVVLSGSIDEEDVGLLQATSLQVARRGVAIQRNRSLSLFRGVPPPAPGCSLDDVGFREGWFPRETHGRWMGGRSAMEVSRCRGVVELSFYAPTTFEPTVLHAKVAEQPAVSVPIVPGQVSTLAIDVGDGRSPLELSVDAPRLPAPGDADQRTLGVLLGDLEDVPER